LFLRSAQSAYLPAWLPELSQPLLSLPDVQVEESLSDDRQSRSSVSSLQKKLLELQQEVNAASEKLAATQARVEQNLQRVNELKAEAVGGDLWAWGASKRSVVALTSSLEPSGPSFA
jgi:septal ring factor EnvC (AmiA/AmiB activator)